MIYAAEDTTVEKLRAIMRIIYDDKPLAGDRRRDLANAMFAVLEEFVPCDPPQQ